jgi:tetratricopeptide (TPR) repeat protein
LLDAFFASRRGDLVEAERINRAVIAARPEQVEAWFQLGEVLFHEGPRLGRPLADAREPFERVVEFEPENTLALTHLARLAASEQRMSGFDSLVARIQRLLPRGDRTIDLTVIRAFAHHDEEDIERVVRELSKAPPVTVPFVVWQLGAYLKDIRGAARLARVGLSPDRSAEWRALSHGILAHLEVGLGRWHAAREQLAALAKLDFPAGLEYGSLLALAPFLPVDTGLSRRLTDSLASWRATASPSFRRAGDESSLLTIHDRLHPRIRAYLLGLWSARGGALDHARRLIDSLEQPGTVGEQEALSRAMAMSIRAHVQGRDERALLAGLERVRLHHWYELHLYSPFYSMAYERYRLAAALETAGREDEALRWYNSFQDHAFYDLAYLAPAHYRRGLIYQRRGDARGAAEHFERFIELWAQCDPELQPLVDDARSRLRR